MDDILLVTIVVITVFTFFGVLAILQIKNLNKRAKQLEDIAKNFGFTFQRKPDKNNLPTTDGGMMTQSFNLIKGRHNNIDFIAYETYGGSFIGQGSSVTRSTNILVNSQIVLPSFIVYKKRFSKIYIGNKVKFENPTFEKKFFVKSDNHEITQIILNDDVQNAMLLAPTIRYIEANKNYLLYSSYDNIVKIENYKQMLDDATSIFNKILQNTKSYTAS